MLNKDLFRKKSVEDILQHADDNLHGGSGQLKKTLNVRDLTALGIGAIIGAGIFSTIGNAATQGGPAVSLLFVITAIACGFSALCYARFASVIPISGSAYTYAYASFGELIAWIIGWDLIMEYAVGNIVVAISWSDYFMGFVKGFGIHIPAYFGIDYHSASKGFLIAMDQLKSGISLDNLNWSIREAYLAWSNAPQLFGIRLIADIPAFTIVVLITYLVYRGIYESKIASNLMVLLKLIILMVVIAVGAFYVNPGNWSPFAPNGLGGVMKGVAGVFFAYIGFDAISTTAEECKNPSKDLPRSMILSLLITTIFYIIISLVLTGMVHYSELGVGDPLAFAFEKVHLTKLSGIIALSAIIAMASVMLVFQVGQPRIWMSMSRDGLLPKIFSKLHPKFKTPAFSTIVTGVVVAVPALFLNLTTVTDLTSIGTLFAFVLVSGGVLVLDNDKKNNKPVKGFRIPYYSSRYVLPLIWIVVFVIIYFTNIDGVKNFLGLNIDNISFNWMVFKHKIPIIIYIITAIVLTYFAIRKQFSIIPVISLLINFYLMTELGITNWLRFLIWLLIGLALYFTYGHKHSKQKKNI